MRVRAAFDSLAPRSTAWVRNLRGAWFGPAGLDAAWGGLRDIYFLLFLAGVAAVFVGNHVVLRRRGWEEFEGRFVQCSARTRWAWMAVAGVVHIAAFAILLSASTMARGG